MDLGICYIVYLKMLKTKRLWKNYYTSDLYKLKSICCSNSQKEAYTYATIFTDLLVVK